MKVYMEELTLAWKSGLCECKVISKLPNQLFPIIGGLSDTVIEVWPSMITL